MYKYKQPKKTTLKSNTGYQGESIETKMQRILNNKEPIPKDASSPIMYTDRKDGVIPATNIRTDRWDIALDAMGAVTQTHLAKREERHKPKETAETAANETKTESKA